DWEVGHTRRFAAAETDRSIYDWYSWYGSSDAQGLTDYEFSGPPWDADSLYRVLSPMTYAKSIRTPLLIVHSEDDRRTPITDGEQLFVMLRKCGLPAEVVRYPRSLPGPGEDERPRTVPRAREEHAGRALRRAPHLEPAEPQEPRSLSTAQRAARRSEDHPQQPRGAGGVARRPRHRAHHVGHPLERSRRAPDARDARLPPRERHHRRH